MLHPDYPVVQGRHALTSEWSIDLPEQFNRRIDDGDLYIWRPGLTLILAVWGNEKSQSPAECIEWLRSDTEPHAYDVMEEREGDLLRLSYRLHEDSDDDRMDALYAFVVGENSHLQIAFYFDDESDLDVVWRILRSVECK